MEPSAAQNGPVIKTCTQCGAIQQARTNVCCFCDAPLALAEEIPCPAAPIRGNLGLDPDWKRELARRVDAFRARRRRLLPNAAQSALSFEAAAQEPLAERVSSVSWQSAGPPHFQAAEDEDNDPAEAAEEFAFAVGIGRRTQFSRDIPSRARVDRVEIDITQPGATASEETDPDTYAHRSSRARADAPYFPVAALADRRFAGAFDAVFLLFAYCGFLALFGSLGGHFSFSKFSVAVYAASLCLFYVQYFALFTFFGGATPGMMLRHLQVVSFDGDAPSPRQLLQRCFGYLLSGGTFLLGFFWALWDEDSLTWQDRISRTHLTRLDSLLAAEPFGGPGDAQRAVHK